MTRSEVIARKKKIRRRKQRAIQRMLCMAALMTAIVAALRAANSYLLRADSPVKPDHSRIQAASAVTVKQPIERHTAQIVADLKAHSETGKKAARIYKNPDLEHLGCWITPDLQCKPFDAS